MLPPQQHAQGLQPEGACLLGLVPSEALLRLMVLQHLICCVISSLFSSAIDEKLRAGEQSQLRLTKHHLHTCMASVCLYPTRL